MEIKEMTHILPSITTKTEPSYSSLNEEYLDLIAYQIEYKRCLKKKDYQGAVDAVNHLFELIKLNPDYIRFDGEETLMKMHRQRAYAYLMAGDLDAAASDIEWVEAHASLDTERENEMVRGLILYLQGRTDVLQSAANRGDRLALLVLNEPENTNPPKTEWLLLNQEDRIKKFLEGRHYAAVIEEINKMDFPNHRWFSEDYSQDDWFALRGVCQALRGHYGAAVKDLEGNYWYYKPNGLERAIIYSRAGRDEDAQKILKQTFTFDELKLELIRRLVGVKAL